MKHIKITILLFLNSVLIFGQSFEGKLVYDIDFELYGILSEKLKISKDALLNKMKEEGSFFDEMTIYIKDGNYIKEDNSTLRRRSIYKSSTNSIFIFLPILLSLV